jgi:hypothetical protein
MKGVQIERERAPAQNDGARSSARGAREAAAPWRGDRARAVEHGRDDEEEIPIGASTTSARRANSAATGRTIIRIAKPRRRSSMAASAAGSSGTWDGARHGRGESAVIEQGSVRDPMRRLGRKL